MRREGRGGRSRCRAGGLAAGRADQDPGGEEREDGEADGEPRDDRVRTPSSAGRGTCEQDRQDRKDARRDRRDDPREEADAEEDEHPPFREGTPGSLTPGLTRSATAVTERATLRRLGRARHRTYRADPLLAPWPAFPVRTLPPAPAGRAAAGRRRYFFFRRFRRRDFPRAAWVAGGCRQARLATSSGAMRSRAPPGGCSRAGCSRRPRRGARRRRGVVARGRQQRVSRRSPRGGVRGSSPARRGAAGLGELSARAAVRAPSAWPRELPRPAGEDLARRVHLAFTDSAQQYAHTRQTVLFPRRRLRHEGDQVVEAGPVDAHADAVGQRDQPQAAVWVLGRTRHQELLERSAGRTALGQLLGEVGPLVEAHLPSRDGRPVLLLVVVQVLGVHTLPLAGDDREATADVGRHRYQPWRGESLRRARRWKRRRGAGVTRAPSR